MSIIVPAGRDYNLILNEPTSRGLCSFPIQASLNTQILPGLPPPPSPEDLQVILDLLTPIDFDVGLEGVPAVPDGLDCVEVPAPNLPPAIPTGLFGIDLMTVAVPQIFTVQLPPAALDLPPGRPTGLSASEVDPPPAIPTGLFGVDTPKVAVPQDFTVQLPPEPEC